MIDCVTDVALCVFIALEREAPMRNSSHARLLQQL
jgi:hypothetical protein